MEAVTPYVPVILEATKFLFNEAGKWLDELRHRLGSSKKPESQVSAERPKLTPERFSEIETNAGDLGELIDREQAATNAYVIHGLVEQIKIHHKNLTDHEAVEAEYGALTPPHVRRAIERESVAVVEKTDRLKGLLEQVYQRRIEGA